MARARIIRSGGGITPPALVGVEGENTLATNTIYTWTGGGTALWPGPNVAGDWFAIANTDTAVPVVIDGGPDIPVPPGFLMLVWWDGSTWNNTSFQIATAPPGPPTVATAPSDQNITLNSITNAMNGPTLTVIGSAIAGNWVSVVNTDPLLSVTIDGLFGDVIGPQQGMLATFNGTSWGAVPF
jgi:hypothetical protein